MTENQALNTNQAEFEEAELVITRTFNAPRELVFQVWTQSEHLAQWWGPKGMKLEVKKLDFRPGGTFHYSMSTPDGFEMWGKFIYQEIVKPEKIVFINSFADAEGNTILPQFSSEFPIEVMNIITFTEQDGQTTLTLRGGPHNATAEQHAFYKGMFDSMKQGFGGTFDQLDAYLSKL
ncbi:SRPBCC domain-containing protein [Paenibacillus sp. GSMTC-2017]|uniref:SRPBCC family protein n=1 Tax=Paenibacillus sp. GSMTC-2017 TaxID=2794350 RepID=UPI0018D83D43|nr:SRPBCC domain-containing protein [Paenibacillus sp. GSMTC-2017]MBH5318781.1 SRPBCC domain-containing protein [Paenibacillus sp. GSMTC-2017]